MNPNPFVLTTMSFVMLVMGSIAQTTVVNSVTNLTFTYGGGSSEMSNTSGVLQIQSKKNSYAFASLPSAYTLQTGDTLSVTMDLTLDNSPANTASSLDLSFSDSTTSATGGTIWDGSYHYTVDLDPVTLSNGLGFSEGDDNNLGKTNLDEIMGTTVHTVTFTLERTGADELTLSFQSPTLKSTAFSRTNDVIPLGTVTFDTFGITFRGNAWNEDFGGSTIIVSIDDFSISTTATSGPATVPTVNSFSYDPVTGDATVSFIAAPNTPYKLVQADDLDFQNPDQDPVALTSASVGTISSDEITTDANGNATVTFNLGTSKSKTFVQIQSP